MEKLNKPNCIGVIMDGNRRYAKACGKMSVEGHRMGYKKLRELLQWSKDAGVKTVIAYALSTENWKRSETELGCLMEIFRFALTNEIEGLKEDRVALKFIGDISKFPADIIEMMKKAEQETEHFKDFTLVLAVSYGGRAEILNAVKKIVKESIKAIISNKLDGEASNEVSNSFDEKFIDSQYLKSINEETFSKYLWTNGITESDMVIRTGGEMRMSNFMPWQTTYSELFFTKTLWPDFSRDEFEAMITEFSNRKRNLGK